MSSVRALVFFLAACPSSAPRADETPFRAPHATVSLLGGFAARLSTVEPQLFVGWRLVDLDTLSLAAGVDYGALLEPASGGYRGVAHRVSLGGRVSFLPPPPPRASPLASTPALRVQVQRPDGSYRFASVGPGPVQVRVEGQGFHPADEVAQVPPEGAAKLDVSLDALGKGSPATVRGLVRSTTGEPLVAAVVIKGLATKVPVTAEGRFVVTVPGGPYLFLISAPGYVPQTKKVVLADGDQAIFHCELQKVSK